MFVSLDYGYVRYSLSIADPWVLVVCVGYWIMLLSSLDDHSKVGLAKIIYIRIANHI